MSGPCLADAAADLAGVPFRLHGRDPSRGLDCVGVVAAAMAASGFDVRAPCGYGLRNSSIDSMLALAQEAGLVPADGDLCAGDILLARPGPAQHHLLVALEGDRFVHAHAGLRRVVIQPGPLPWRVARRWRLAPKES